MTSVRPGQRGVALITALVVLAIAATLSAAMIWQGGLDERRTATLIQGNQATEYALGAESWAEQILQRDFKQSSQSVNLGQDWAQQLPPLPVEGGQIIGHIEDMQGRFNLDLLSGSSATVYQAQFVRILEALDLDPTIAPALTDWFSNNPVANPNGAKDDFYSRLQPPYLTGEVPMTSVSELQLVKGVTPQAYAALLPYICAIPVTTSVASGTGTSTTTNSWALNINTASPLLLMSLSQNISQDLADQVVAARAASGISQQEFTKITAVQSGNGTNSQMPPTGVNSSYFLLTVTAEIGSTHVTMYSLLRYTGGQTIAIRRTFGTL